MVKRDAENNTQESYDELDAVSTAEELIIYLAKEIARRSALDPGKARKGPDARELAKMKEVITDPQTADRVIEALDLMHQQGLGLMMDILDKTGSKSFYRPPNTVPAKKGN